MLLTISVTNKKEGGVPTGIRTPVTAVKGRCPRPLDDGDPERLMLCSAKLQRYKVGSSERRAFYESAQERSILKTVKIAID